MCVQGTGCGTARADDPVLFPFEPLHHQLSQTVIVFDDKDDIGSDLGQDRLPETTNTMP